MTVIIPKKTIGDWILGLFGKKRAIYVPSELYKTYGAYVYAKATRESFWRAMLRPKGGAPPLGWTYFG
jgi:hypothetical protein